MYSFPFVFHSNYGVVLYCFRDIASYWSKINNSLYHIRISTPHPVEISLRCLTCN